MQRTTTAYVVNVKENENMVYSTEYGSDRHIVISLGRINRIAEEGGDGNFR